jgi:3-oxoacyl-[acyl-carrier protein] reductase
VLLVLQKSGAFIRNCKVKNENKGIEQMTEMMKRSYSPAKRFAKPEETASAVCF